MSNLLTRIKRLEGFQTDNKTLVYIFRWASGLGERSRVEFNGHFIERKEGESEDVYLDRAYIEIRHLADPKQKVLTAFAWQ